MCAKERKNHNANASECSDANGETPENRAKISIFVIGLPQPELHANPTGRTHAVGKIAALLNFNCFLHVEEVLSNVCLHVALFTLLLCDMSSEPLFVRMAETYF